MKKILIIGAGFLQAYVIKRAKQLGYYTLAVDANPEAIGFEYSDEHEAINIVDKDACLAYAREKRIDGVMTAATDYGVLTASYIAQQMNLPGLNYDAAKKIKNKYSVRCALFASQVDDTPEAYEVRCAADAEKIANTISYPVMVKPCDGSGSRGASKVECAERLASAVESAIESSLTQCALIETFIVGEEYGAETFVYNGKPYVMAVMKKKMTEHPYYAELGHEIPSGFDMEFEKKIRNCVERAVTALNINFGAVNMDLLVTKEGGVHIVDIGARMGGNLIGSHIVPLGTGIDYIGNLVKIAVSDEPDMTVKPHAASVVSRLLALTPGMIKTLPDFAEIEKKHGVIIEHHLERSMQITPYRTNLDGCGYVVAVSDDATNSRLRAEAALCDIDCGIERE